MAHPVLQARLPSAPWMVPALRRLPGVQPLDLSEWLVADEAFSGQMALRDRLIADRRDAVVRLTPGAGAAAAEVLETVLTHLPPGYSRTGRHILRPDGVAVDPQADAALVTAARLVQEDLCILQKPEGAEEHVLTAAVLCFPASWTLSEKIGRPLGAIHGPVASYDAGMAARVQRMFDALAPGRALWRQNALLYAAPDLHQPRTEADPRAEAHLDRPYLRSERQALLHLPRTGAILFSIHTYVVPVADLPEDQRAGLAAQPPGHAGHGG